MDCSLSLRRSPRSSRPVMEVEHLESRMCPAAPKGAPALSYIVTEMTDPQVTVTGRVTGTYAANSTVVFTGAVSNTIVTDGMGNFSFTLPANYLGTVSGVAWDNHGVQTSVINKSVVSLPPSFVSFSASLGANNVWTFSGQISNENVSNQTITFSGFDDLNGASTTTDASGYFSIGFQLADTDAGVVTATVADCWSLTGGATVSI